MFQELRVVMIMIMMIICFRRWGWGRSWSWCLSSTARAGRGAWCRGSTWRLRQRGYLADNEGESRCFEQNKDGKGFKNFISIQKHFLFWAENISKIKNFSTQVLAFFLLKTTHFPLEFSAKYWGLSRSGSCLTCLSASTPSMITLSLLVEVFILLMTGMITWRQCSVWRRTSQTSWPGRANI